MLCQSCGKNEANTHVKKILNNKVEEYFLCDQCAKKMGYNSVFNDFNLDLESFLGGFLSDNVSSEIVNETLRCKNCGSSFEDISSTGKVGCAKCYDVFRDKLMPFIKRIHGNTNHSGKLAGFTDEFKKKKRKINELKTDLNNAVKKQEFELAAKIRDEIKDLEREVKDND